MYLTTVELCGSLYGFLTKAQTYVSALQRCLYYVGTGADVGMVQGFVSSLPTELSERGFGKHKSITVAVRCYCKTRIFFINKGLN